MYKSNLKQTSESTEITVLSEVEISKLLGGFQEQVSAETIKEISCIYDRKSGKTEVDVNGEVMETPY